MENSIGEILFKGKKTPIYLQADLIQDLRLINGVIKIKPELLQDQAKFEKAYNEMCQAELSKIIDKQISKLRGRKIKINMLYNDGKKRPFEVSVDSYLKLFKFDQKLDYKIGVYEKEWGINELKTGAKNFTLYFNLNLVKFDSGTHIEYVVAHELTHVFFRDHGPDFQDALAKLYPRKAESENFFNSRIGFLFGKQDNSLFYFFFFGLLVSLVIYWIWLQIGSFIKDILPSSPPKSQFY